MQRKNKENSQIDELLTKDVQKRLTDSYNNLIQKAKSNRDADEKDVVPIEDSRVKT